MNNKYGLVESIKNFKDLPSNYQIITSFVIFCLIVLPIITYAVVKTESDKMKKEDLITDEKRVRKIMYISCLFVYIFSLIGLLMFKGYPKTVYDKIYPNNMENDIIYQVNDTYYLERNSKTYKINNRILERIDSLEDINVSRK